MPTTAQDVALAAMRRKTFIGTTNKYAPYRTPAGDVAEQAAKELGILDVAVSAGVYNSLYVQTAQTRVNQYKNYIKFFKGQHWTAEFEDGERKPVTNFCKTIVQKSTAFFVASGFTFRAVEGNEEVANALSLVWEANGGNHLFRSVALEASMLGDSYLLFYIRTTDEITGKPLPANKHSLGIKQLSAVCVFPVFNKQNKGQIDVCVVQYPTAVVNGSVTFETQIYYPDKIRTYVDSQDDKNFTETPNPFGFVPIVHVPNRIDPTSEYGLSDLFGITELNEEYNSVKLAIRRILNYHSEPTTVIFGARASKLEKGSKKVWSNLPVEARVENLAFESDLSSSYQYLTSLRTEIMNESGLPEVAFQTNNPISNTSGIALRILYAPLYEKKTEKEEAFSLAFKHIIRCMQRGMELLGINLAVLADEPNKLSDITPAFSDPLPRDLSAELDADIKKLSARITSRATLVRKYHSGENIARLATEIAADEVSALALKREEAVALASGKPNLVAPFLSSVSINEEMEDMAKQTGSLLPDDEETSTMQSDSTQEKHDASQES